MVISASHSSPQDPFSLVETCQKAVEWILRSYTAQGKPIPRCWMMFAMRKCRFMGRPQKAFGQKHLLPN